MLAVFMMSVAQTANHKMAVSGLSDVNFFAKWTRNQIGIFFYTFHSFPLDMAQDEMFFASDLLYQCDRVGGMCVCVCVGGVFISLCDNTGIYVRSEIYKEVLLYSLLFGVFDLLHIFKIF